MIQIGDQIPNTQVTIMTEQGPSPVAAGDLLGHGLTVLFATPGAFTPTCSAQHLPSFMEKFDELKAAGVDQVACIAVNDVFVINAWAKATGADAGQIIMIADGNGDFTRDMGLEMDISAFGMGTRSQRFAMIIRDGKVEALMVEAPGEFKVSSAESVLQALNKA